MSKRNRRLKLQLWLHKNRRQGTLFVLTLMGALSYAWLISNISSQLESAPAATGAAVLYMLGVTVAVGLMETD
ncbi:MAG: hypothetical protein AAFX02_02235 [Pseudomonadota bacterium]